MIESADSLANGARLATDACVVASEQRRLGLTWSPHAQGLQSCAAWLGGGDESYAPMMGKTACTH